jgi:hypothetical protein
VDPRNAEWQADLAGAHYRLAELIEVNDPEGARRHFEPAFVLLENIRQQGIEFGQYYAHIHACLAAMFPSGR